MSDDGEPSGLTGGPEDTPNSEKANPRSSGSPGGEDAGTSTDGGEQLSRDSPNRTTGTDETEAAQPASVAPERDGDVNPEAITGSAGSAAPGSGEGIDVRAVPAGDASEGVDSESADEAAAPVMDPIAKAISEEVARLRLQKKLTWAVALGVIILPIVCFSLFPPSGVFGGKGDSNELLAVGRSNHGRAAIVTSTTRSTMVIRDDARSLGLLTTTSTTASTAPPVRDGATTTRLSTTTSSSSTSSSTTRLSTTTSTSTTSTSTTTSTTTTRPPQQPRRLGGIDWGRWCQSAGFVRATLDHQNGYGWFCVDAQGGRHAIDTFEACERQYGVPDGLAVGQLTNYYDPNSWVCWRINRYLGTLTESGFRSWCRSAGYVDIRLNGPTAYDWDCVDSAGRFGGPDTRESCRYVYSSPNAIEVLANFFDPGGWRCYT